MTDQLTQTELMVIDYEFNRTMRELSKIIPSIDSLDYRRPAGLHKKINQIVL